MWIDLIPKNNKWEWGDGTALNYTVSTLRTTNINYYNGGIKVAGQKAEMTALSRYNSYAFVCEMHSEYCKYSERNISK